MIFLTNQQGFLTTENLRKKYEAVAKLKNSTILCIMRELGVLWKEYVYH